MAVAAIVVTYNPDLAATAQLVNEVLSQVDAVIVVDNGSDNIQAIDDNLRTISLAIILLKMGHNLGIGAAQNAGIRKAIEVQMDHVILFDQDSLPPAHMVDDMLKAEKSLLAQGYNVAALGPCFKDPRTNNFYPISRFEGIKLKRIYPDTENTQPILASFVIASGSLIRLSVLKTVGLMNEDLFIDYVDVEWGFRASSMGFDTFGIPSVVLLHQVGDRRLKILGREISVHSPMRRYYLARNGQLIMRMKHIPYKYKARELFYTLLRAFVFILLVGEKKTYLSYICKGWIDGILGRAGPLRK